jgi:signal transduction histidine kinase
MEQPHEDFGQVRARTDGSLGAERAATDAVAAAGAEGERALDDRIERDRILADSRLWEFRERADFLLARNRAASPWPTSSVAVERVAADESKRVEREETDSVLEQERRDADAADFARRDREAHDEQLEVHRHDTNSQLSLERSSADTAVAAFGETKNALAHSERQGARANDVLAFVTHDLRSPLSIIAANAELIAGDTNEALTREAAQEVTFAAARMERLLTDLLDVARIEAGVFRIVKRRHDVSALLAEVFCSYRPLFAARRMSFAGERPVTEVFASFDRDRIVQVLSNLLGNAMKFTPINGTISLQAERRDGGIEFMVRDNGPGIHPDVLPHVFERFWQIDSNTRRGLGLGLYICEKIVEAHNGRIWAESDFGKGATFRFTLPE